MAKIFRNFFKLAANDLANQYALPVKSMTGSVLTRRGAAATDFLNKAVVQLMQLDPDDAVLEIGYGRGNGIKHCLKKLEGGNGFVCGIERSSYMEDVAQKRFILEAKETEKVRFDHALDLRNLPYPTDMFHHIFHVDVFYFLHHDRLLSICQELRRVLRPGGSLTCAMQFDRLKRLTSWGLLNEAQWDPMRYMGCLEPAGFVDIKITYHEDPARGKYQMITAKKPDEGEDYYDAMMRMEQLESDIKREMLAVELMRSGKRPSPDDLELLREEPKTKEMVE